jgi:hypothetical protein
MGCLWDWVDVCINACCLEINLSIDINSLILALELFEKMFE